MVKFYESFFSYDYPFSAVTLAYFLRYPNPYSTHVLSTDVIDRSFDPATQRLTTVRLINKRSMVPPTLMKLLPRSLVGTTAAGADRQSYVLERSTVDVKEGWMESEQVNLEWTGVVRVVEKQMFRRPREVATFGSCEKTAVAHGLLDPSAGGRTDVTTTVMILSQLGQARKRRARSAAVEAEPEEDAPARVGFFKSWSTAKLQQIIEDHGWKRATKSQPNATKGMKLVLERLRQGGLVGVLEAMRKDSETGFGRRGLLKQLHGGDVEERDAQINGLHDDDDD